MTALAIGACGETSTAPPGDEYNPSVVVQWDEAALEAIRHSSLGPPMAARALAVVHTTMYDAWAAYDAQALGTMRGAELRRPAAEHTAANKQRAVSIAAYRALVDLFPTQQGDFDALLQTIRSGTCRPTRPSRRGRVTTPPMRCSPSDTTMARTSSAISRQAPTPTTRATSRSTHRHRSTTRIAGSHCWYRARGWGSQAQRFIAPHWGLVTPFALTSGAQFRPASMPNLYPSAGYAEQAQELIDLSADLTDEQKTITEFWADGPGHGTPAGPLG